MALQAQLPCNAFSPGFRPSRAQPQRIRDDDDVFFHPEVANQLHTLEGGGEFLNVAVALSVDHPQSDLTCNNNNNNNNNVSASTRKRPSSMADQIGLVDQHATINNLLGRYPPSILHAGAVMPIQSRLYGSSAGTSTSGRPSVPSASTAPTISQADRFFASLFYQEKLEVEALLRLQAERLRSGLEQASKRQCRALLSSVEQQVLERLTDKESELETANRRNMGLEEKVRMLSAENQIWFNVAKKNEAIASSLRNAVEQQVVLQTTRVAATEGYGDSDDARSCCFDSDEDKSRVEERTTTTTQWEQQKRLLIRGEEEERMTMCKVCVEREVCVLLLPCRHLCLCKECEPTLDACPICCSTKNASLQIFLS